MIFRFDAPTIGRKPGCLRCPTLVFEFVDSSPSCCFASVCLQRQMPMDRLWDGRRLLRASDTLRRRQRRVGERDPDFSGCNPYSCSRATGAVRVNGTTRGIRPSLQSPAYTSRQAPATGRPPLTRRRRCRTQRRPDLPRRTSRNETTIIGAVASGKCLKKTGVGNARALLSYLFLRVAHSPIRTQLRRRIYFTGHANNFLGFAQLGCICILLRQF